MNTGQELSAHGLVYSGNQFSTRVSTIFPQQAPDCPSIREATPKRTMRNPCGTHAEPGSLATANDAPGPGQYDVSLAMEVQGFCFVSAWKSQQDAVSLPKVVVGNGMQWVITD